MEDQSKLSHTWWQKNKRLLIIAAVSILVLLLVFALPVCLFGWEWTGLNSYTPPTKASNFQRGKTLWDWLQLLVIPIMLVIGGFWLNQIHKNREEKAAKQRSKDEREIVHDSQQETALQGYIDKISELLLKEGLRESKPEDEVRKIARVRTLTVLTRLDAMRKREVMQFLYESALISIGKRVVDLRGSDLSKANLSMMNLSGSDLSGIDLAEVNLGGAI